MWTEKAKKKMRLCHTKILWFFSCYLSLKRKKWKDLVPYLGEEHVLFRFFCLVLFFQFFFCFCLFVLLFDCFFLVSLLFCFFLVFLLFCFCLCVCFCLFVLLFDCFFFVFLLFCFCLCVFAFVFFCFVFCFVFSFSSLMYLFWKNDCQTVNLRGLIEIFLRLVHTFQATTVSFSSSAGMQTIVLLIVYYLMYYRIQLSPLHPLLNKILSPFPICSTKENDGYEDLLSGIHQFKILNFLPLYFCFFSQNKKFIFFEIFWIFWNFFISKWKNSRFHPHPKLWPRIFQKKKNKKIPPF